VNAPKFLLAAVVVALGLFVTGCAEAASFDCSKAKARIEKMICADKTLDDLDGRLATAYLSALHVSEDQDQIIRSQRQWLKMRDACSDKACVTDVYRKRLSTLKAQARDGDPCAGETMREIANCTGTQVRRADLRLARYVDAARNTLKTDEPEALAALDKAETAFAAYREAACDADVFYYNGATREALFEACYLDETEQHTQRIWEKWLSGAATGSSPVLPDPSQGNER